MNVGGYWLAMMALLAPGASVAEAGPAAQAPPLEEVEVWGESLAPATAASSAPTSVLAPPDFAAINAVTTEDLVKYEPSVVIRRRFIGDANGTLGIRGANMFQTSRSLVFADGVPLHYLLQSRWSGAPRWTMVSASEIAQVEVIYGPYSAAYSGNAMGGVIIIETAIPTEREIQVDLSAFTQQFDAYGYSDAPSGHKGFIAYGDKFGDLSVYLSYNRLAAHAQPQSFYFASASEAANPTAVSGLIPGFDALPDPQGRPQTYGFYGDTGSEHTITDNYKLKLGYELGAWRGLFNLAYEDRAGHNHPNSYARGVDGASVWSGPIEWAGQILEIPGSRLAVSELERQSLSASLRLAGPVAAGVEMTFDLNHFSVLTDTTGVGALNPRDPGFDGSGEVTDFRDSGWSTAGVDLSMNDWLDGDLSLRAGARAESYRLNLDLYDSPDYAAAVLGAISGSSGGRTQTRALYAEADWQWSEHWDVIAGLRYERFRSDGGYYSEGTGAELTRIATPNSVRETWSPKLSIGFEPDERWTLRYSMARAYRFPIVEELFSQFAAYNTISEANPELNPEAGWHHNLLINRELDHGYLRINLFQESVRDVIESQVDIIRQGQDNGVSVRTFVPIDEVATRGVEWIYNSERALGTQLAVRANLTWTQATIERNDADPTIVGNQFPRMPKWRANLLANYPVTEQLTASINWQYASDSFGRLDNRDRIDRVYGAQDSYSRISLRGSYKFNNNWQIAVGVDNITDQLAYVAHPWPGRTVYLDLHWQY